MMYFGDYEKRHDHLKPVEELLPPQRIWTRCSICQIFPRQKDTPSNRQKLATNLLHFSLISVHVKVKKTPFRRSVPEETPRTASKPVAPVRWRARRGNWKMSGVASTGLAQQPLVGHLKRQKVAGCRDSVPSVHGRPQISPLNVKARLSNHQRNLSLDFRLVPILFFQRQKDDAVFRWFLFLALAWS